MPRLPRNMKVDRCPKVPRLPCNMKVDVKKWHACHTTWRSMSKSATPALIISHSSNNFNQVHVLVHTQAQQPHHLSCCPADTGTPLSWSVTIGLGWGGWGGVIAFMFLCTHRHSNLIIFLAVQQTQALLIHDQLPVRWGVVGGAG